MAKDSSGAKLLALVAALLVAPHAYRVALPENQDLHSRLLGHSSANATNLAIVRNRVCRKSGKKPHAKARRRQVSELTTFAPLREKFHAAIFLLLNVFKLPCSGVHREVSVLVPFKDEVVGGPEETH